MRKKRSYNKDSKDSKDKEGFLMVLRHMNARKKTQLGIIVGFIILVALVTIVGLRKNIFRAETPTDVNLLVNPSFEEGLRPPWNYYSNDGTNHQDPGASATIVTEGCPSGKCLKIQPGPITTWQAAYQVVGNLTPGYYYTFSTKAKTTTNHRGFINLHDKTSGQEYSVNTAGTNDWMTLARTVRIPLTDSAGNSTANHNWQVWLYGHFPTANRDAVYYDDVSLVGSATFEQDKTAFGCANNETAKCLDFGATDETVSGATFETAKMSAKSTEGDLNFRSLNPKQTPLTLTFPAFNVDSQGLPLTPMLLEVKYKDTIDGLFGSNGYSTKHRAIIKSRIDYLSSDALVSPDKRNYGISYLGEDGSNTWRLQQYAFQKSQFQLIRAIDGKFTFTIQMPYLGTVDDALTLPIDYIALREISQDQYKKITDTQRADYRFYPVNPPVDEPQPAINYANPEVTIFTRDPMKPIYQTTKPSQEEIDQPLIATSALDLTEPLNFAVYSKNGVNGISVSATDLSNGSQIISKNNIQIQKVVYGESTLHSYIQNRAYGTVADHLEDFSTLDIESGVSQRIWLKVKVPADLAGGLYEGNVSIYQNGNLIKSLPMQLKVIPIKLDHSANLNIIYHDPFSKTYSSNFNGVISLYQEAGFDQFLWGWVEGPPPVKQIIKDNKLVDFDTTKLSTELDRMIASGLIKNTAIFELGPVWEKAYKTVYNNQSPRTDYANLYIRLNDPQFKNLFILAVNKIVDLGKQNNINFYFSVTDEPGVDPFKRMASDRLYTFLKEMGQATTVTYYANCDTEISSGPWTTPTGKIPPLTDLIDYKVIELSQSGAGFAKNYSNFGYYTTVMSFLRNPIYNRFLHGLFAYRTNAKVVSAYAFGDLVVDPFNDFDGGTTYIPPFWYPDFLLAYPTWSGKLLPTMALEGLREGVKDGQYLATLQRLMKEHPGAVSDEAQKYLDSVKARLGTNYWNDYAYQGNPNGHFNAILKSVSDSDNADDYAAFSSVRKNMADYIEKLAATPVELPKPTATPTPTPSPTPVTAPTTQPTPGPVQVSPPVKPSPAATTPTATTTTTTTKRGTTTTKTRTTTLDKIKNAWNNLKNRLKPQTKGFSEPKWNQNSPVRIPKFSFNARGIDNVNLNGEFVILRNDSQRTVNLLGWRVENARGQEYLLPDYSLNPGQSVWLHTGQKWQYQIKHLKFWQPSATPVTISGNHIYMGQAQEFWNNYHDTLLIYNSQNQLIYMRSY